MQMLQYIDENLQEIMANIDSVLYIKPYDVKNKIALFAVIKEKPGVYRKIQISKEQSKGMFPFEPIYWLNKGPMYFSLNDFIPVLENWMALNTKNMDGFKAKKLDDNRRYNIGIFAAFNDGSATFCIREKEKKFKKYGGIEPYNNRLKAFKNPNLQYEKYYPIISDNFNNEDTCIISELLDSYEIKSEMFSDELIDAFENKRNKENKLEKFVDDKSKNVNPLTEIPKPQMKLYGFSGAFSCAFFETEEELIEYVKTSDTAFGNICVIEYLGKVANRSDVIRVSYKDRTPKLYTSIDEDGYAIYNDNRSIEKGEYVWEYMHGNISEMYSAFRDRGIVFEEDTYAEIESKNRKMYEMLDQNRKGPVLTKKK